MGDEGRAATAVLAFCAGGAAAAVTSEGKSLLGCSRGSLPEEGGEGERGGRNGGHLGSVCDTFNVVGSGEGGGGGDGEAAEARQVSERREGGTARATDSGRFRTGNSYLKKSQMALCLLVMTQANNMPNSQHMHA